jgi:hypothetical protein
LQNAGFATGVDLVTLSLAVKLTAPFRGSTSAS